jgi:hypothetical protein
LVAMNETLVDICRSALTYPHTNARTTCNQGNRKDEFELVRINIVGRPAIYWTPVRIDKEGHRIVRGRAGRLRYVAVTVVGEDPEVRWLQTIAFLSSNERNADR